VDKTVIIEMVLIAVLQWFAERQCVGVHHGQCPATARNQVLVPDHVVPGQQVGVSREIPSEYDQLARKAVWLRGEV
jgi:hypothetical protein